MDTSKIWNGKHSWMWRVSFRLASFAITPSLIQDRGTFTETGDIHECPQSHFRLGEFTNDLQSQLRIGTFTGSGAFINVPSFILDYSHLQMHMTLIPSILCFILHLIAKWYLLTNTRAIVNPRHFFMCSCFWGSELKCAFRIKVHDTRMNPIPGRTEI